jgi:hypothetical protein
VMFITSDYVSKQHGLYYYLVGTDEFN